MKRKNVLPDKVSVEQEIEEYELEETPELRATVELETQAKIDSDVRDAIAAADELGRPYGMTLEAQERWEAREAEIRRTREREDRGQESIREELCRKMTIATCERTVEAALDPHDELDAETRRKVREQAVRLEEKSRGGLGVPAIEAELAVRVKRKRSVQEAVLSMIDDVQAAPGSFVALGKLRSVGRRWVDVDARVVELWEPSAPSMQQVGLLEDETGRTKVTVWKRSRQPIIDEGERVRIRDASMSWYQGRPSIALTGRSFVTFPERDAWWE